LQSSSTRLCVCMSVRLKNHIYKLHEIFCTHYLWPWLSTPLMTTQYVMYFRFRWRLRLTANLSSLAAANALVCHGRHESTTHGSPRQPSRQTSAFAAARGDKSAIRCKHPVIMHCSGFHNLKIEMRTRVKVCGMQWYC